MTDIIVNGQRYRENGEPVRGHAQHHYAPGAAAEFSEAGERHPPANLAERLTAESALLAAAVAEYRAIPGDYDVWLDARRARKAATKRYVALLDAAPTPGADRGIVYFEWSRAASERAALPLDAEFPVRTAAERAAMAPGGVVAGSAAVIFGSDGPEKVIPLAELDKPVPYVINPAFADIVATARPVNTSAPAHEGNPVEYGPGDVDDELGDVNDGPWHFGGER